MPASSAVVIHLPCHCRCPRYRKAALAAAYAGAEPKFIFEAVAAALAAYGVCGEIAYESLKPGEGCGTFAVRLFDAVGNLDVTAQAYINIYESMLMRPLLDRSRR